jgi:putative inorganic carbon (HCO3(-)) transporter
MVAPVSSFWSSFTLTQFDFRRWQQGSLAYGWLGLGKQWQASSWLMQSPEGLGTLLISVLLVLSPYITTSLIGALLLLCGAYLGLLMLSQQEMMIATPIHLGVMIYWSIAVLATGFSPAKSHALSGLVVLTLYLVLFFLGARIMRAAPARNIIILCLLLTALVVASYGVRQEYFGVDPLATWNDPESLMADDTRVYSYLGNPNLLAGYLLPAIAFSGAALCKWQRWLPKALALTMVLINIACLYFTDSRGGWLALTGELAVFTLGLFFYWRSYLPAFWRTWFLPIVFGSGLLLVGAAIATVEPLRIRILSIFAGRGDSSNNFRINVWEGVFRMIKAYPIFGIGVGHDAFNAIYPRFMNPKYTALSSYSIYLEHLVEMGYVGFTIFLWLLVLIFNQSILQFKKLRAEANPEIFWIIGAIAASVGLLIHGLVDTVWYRPQINTLWWFCLALISSYYNPLTINAPSKKEVL